ncbi:ABC transporter ATP-binding protein [Clostridium sp. D2Q-14]|uniref:ABC transporter ATP-binding protein n=1 Tax=Anaeromonas gelatinilytica TaxID=2683194 RepID=UPI00193C0033|nr:ABC transporter ATP-binding protein [Anaeromonas gelatinilytica]MBS4534343.1 ABC transporter ATP-binding protein [Anaeromonas gelatinilytica]
MLKKLKEIFSLTDRGIKNVKLSIFTATLHNLSVLFPTILLFLVASGLLSHYWGERPNTPNLFFCWSIALILLVLIYSIYRLNYEKTYRTAYEESANTRISLAEKLRKLPLSYFGEKDLSDLTSTLMNDTATLEHTLANDIPSLFGGIISSLFVVIILFFFNWKLTISMFICLPVAFIILAASYKVSNSVNWKNRNAKLSVSDGLQEFLDNMKLMYASPKASEYRNSLEGKVRKVVRTSLLYEVVMGIFISLAYNVLRIGMALVIITGAALLTKQEVSIYTFLLFLFIASQIYDPLTNIIFRTGEFFYSLVSASRIRDIENYCPQTGRTDVNINQYDIVFDSVSFAYYEGQDVIKNVSFIAKQGEITALVGPSGCGKSTLSKLACRFWDVPEGRVIIDGKNINEIDPETLLNYFSIVFQDVVLFNDTIYNNIKIGKKDATEEEIYCAAGLAQCEDFIQKLPEGYETIIGENGKTLSGGERQRISIARAFLKDAPIILLDEATASLDPENETLIQEAIGRLVKNKTVLIIAHRLRSVESCDQIIVLNKGQIQEHGTHEELIKVNGLYHHLFELQRESAGWSLNTERI